MKAQEFVEEALKKNKNLSTMTYGFWYEMMEAYLESRMPEKFSDILRWAKNKYGYMVLDMKPEDLAIHYLKHPPQEMKEDEK